MLRTILSKPTLVRVAVFAALSWAWAWPWPAIVGCVESSRQTDPGLQQAPDGKDDDPEAEVESKRKFWVEVANRDVADLAKLTDKWPVSVAFLEEMESHFADYIEIENKMRTDFEAKLAQDPNATPQDRFAKPKPEVLISIVLESETYKSWCNDQKLDPEGWIRQLARLRGLLGAKSLREIFDPSRLRKQLDDLLSTDLGIPPSTQLMLIRTTEVNIRVSPHVLNVLNNHEPKWGEEELKVHTSYARDLNAFLLDPKKSPFKKKDVDRRLEEEAKKKEEEARKNEEKKPSGQPEEK